jgi:hypothetical protein
MKLKLLCTGPAIQINLQICKNESKFRVPKRKVQGSNENIETNFISGPQMMRCNIGYRFFSTKPPASDIFSKEDSGNQGITYFLWQ